MELINFMATDGVNLEGILYKASSNISEKIILSVHGMTSNCFKKRDIEIAKKANEKGIDYFAFNNRGSEIVKYIEKETEGQPAKELAGTAYEDVLEGYEDIVGAIIKLKELGYKNIYLQGHSLGCTKIVYTYNELINNDETEILENIKGVILLSLVDIPMALKVYLRDNFKQYLDYAEKLEHENKIYEMMPRESFIHPISVKSFLRYARDNKDIDFANYGKDNELEKLNNIQVPLFMRWGNDNEMIIQQADELSTMVNNIITNENKNIDYIDGANHSYTGKEKELAEQIVEFVLM
ncbi:MAG: DUF1749 domain-containing protein [Clostridiales bacterium]|nr:DUF1749 domain-containing protein [Clostridiales bacterium]